MPHSRSRNLAFLHGFLGGPQDWAPFDYEGFSSSYLTLPGHQMSPLPTTQPLLNDMIRCLKKQMPKGKTSLIGYSLGGRLALHYAKMYPEQIESLVLLSTHPGLQSGREERKARDTAWAKLLEKEKTIDFLKAWYAQPLFEGLDWQSLKNRTLHDRASLSRVLQELSPAVTSNSWKDLQHFPFKTFFLFGVRDRKYLKIAAQLKKLNAKVKVDLISHASHAVHIENPIECYEKINQFLKGVR